jgi:hypothetical protein
LDNIGNADQSLRAEDSSLYYFSKCKLISLNDIRATYGIISLDGSSNISYNDYTKCLKIHKDMYVLVDSVNKMFYTKSLALRYAKLFDIAKDISDQEPITRWEHYHNAYFNDANIMSSFDEGINGVQGEYSYYEAYEQLLNHYFHNREFSVVAQLKSKVFYQAGEQTLTDDTDKPKGIIKDYCVKIRDPKLYKD